MKYRKLDDNMDYTLGRKPGDAFYEDSEATIQAIVTRLNLLLEEWWEDLDDGLPLFQQILGVYNDREDVELLLTDRILGTQGMQSVIDISSTRDADSRQFSYIASVTTVYGDTEGMTLAFDGIHFVRVTGKEAT